MLPGNGVPLRPRRAAGCRALRAGIGWLVGWAAVSWKTMGPDNPPSLRVAWQAAPYHIAHGMCVDDHGEIDGVSS